MAEQDQDWRPAHDSLAAYLNDHLVGAETGVRLFRAAGDTWRGSEYESVFTSLAGELSDERDELENLITALGYGRSRFKALAGWAGALVGRMGPLDPLGTGGGATGQLELETLQSLVRQKESMWRTLLVLSGRDRRFNPARLAELLDAAQRQQQEVAHVMEQTAVDRFLP